MFGATGGTGRAVIENALSAGHAVTAFARRADRIVPADGLTVIQGDVMDSAQVAPALDGQDAVVISLGECQDFCVRLIGSMLPERSKDDDNIERTAGRVAEGLQAA